MAIADNTGSILDDNGLNRTGTSLSTNIVIEVNGVAVGAIQSLSVNESRNIVQIDEVGHDGHIDSVPTKSTDISGSCQRTRFDKMRIAEAFNRGFLHVSAQRLPFDIVIHDEFADVNQDDSGTIITTIKNVWIAKIGYDYKADNFVIVDNMDWQAETISSTLGNASQNVVGTVNARGDNIQFLNPTERAADRGERRGALDVPGLIEAFNET